MYNILICIKVNKFSIKILVCKFIHIVKWLIKNYALIYYLKNQEFQLPNFFVNNNKKYLSYRYLYI
jgi:hypothetical protein